MRTFAIGDIHGCFTALETLLDCLELQPEDRLIFLGDYIDRGPDSHRVLEKLIELSANPRHVFLRGNHDDWLLTARTETKTLQSWRAVGGKQTLESYGVKSIEEMPASHLGWLEKTRAFFHLEG